MLTPEKAVFISIIICVVGAALTLADRPEPDADRLARLFGGHRQRGADLFCRRNRAGRGRFNRLPSPDLVAGD